MSEEAHRPKSEVRTLDNPPPESITFARGGSQLRGLRGDKNFLVSHERGENISVIPVAVRRKWLSCGEPESKTNQLT